MGVVEEVGADVKKVKKGERYVCCFDIGCGECFYCQRQLYCCCMRSNPSNMTCGLYGHKLGGFYGEALNAFSCRQHILLSMSLLRPVKAISHCMPHVMGWPGRLIPCIVQDPVKPPPEER